MFSVQTCLVLSSLHIPWHITSAGTCVLHLKAGIVPMCRSRVYIYCLCEQVCTLHRITKQPNTNQQTDTKGSTAFVTCKPFHMSFQMTERRSRCKRSIQRSAERTRSALPSFKILGGCGGLFETHSNQPIYLLWQENNTRQGTTVSAFYLT